MSDFASQLNLWIQQLRAIAQTGLAFDPSTYDRERYEQLLLLAAQMASTNGAARTDERLAQQLYEHWRASVEPGVKGYVTPKVGVGAAVFNDRDEILLIKRTTGEWLDPTGWSDIGYSPASVAVKEVREETGLDITPLRLIAVYDAHTLADQPEVPIHFYSLVFYCRLDGGKLVPHPVETQGAGWFSRDGLPSPLARLKRGWVDLAWAAHNGELKEAYFDKP